MFACRVSGSFRYTSPRLSAASRAPIIAGALVSNRNSTPPSAGPNTKPSPKATPTMAIARLRSLVGFVSARTACAVDMLAAPIPARPREIKSIASDDAAAKRLCPSIVKNMVQRSIPLLPRRSDAAPQSGAKINCISA